MTSAVSVTDTKAYTVLGTGPGVGVTDARQWTVLQNLTGGTEGQFTTDSRSYLVLQPGGVGTLNNTIVTDVNIYTVIQTVVPSVAPVIPPPRRILSMSGG